MSVVKSAPVPACFSVLLRRHRLAIGATQEELAERAGMSARGVSDLERGVRTHPYPSTVRRLADALNLSESDRSALVQAGCGPQERVVRQLTVVRPDFSVHRSVSRRGASTVPDEPNRFIGRQRETAEITAFFQRPDARMLTLTGPGGIGKTRLATNVCDALRYQWPDGITFVSLAALSAGTLVLPAIAQALGVEEDNRKEHEPVIHEYLRDRETLLVLDNFEHVLEAAPAVASLLDACRGLRVMVTSRILLHVRREHAYDVAPLTFPSAAASSEPDTLREYDAVALLEERARAVLTGFAVDGTNGRTVAEICGRLDGLPLAIELAAAQLKYFSPAALATRLNHRLSVLVGGARDLPSRQRTLRDTIDWSYSLLDEGEQSLFAALSVFTGGCSLAAVDAVCGRDAIEVVEGVISLVDKSLLQRAEGDEPRFTMLETVREFAAEMLEAGGRAETVQRQHAHYFRALSERAEAALQGVDQHQWLIRLEENLDNLRAALAWSIERDPETGLRIMIATYPFWLMRDHVVEAREWFRRTLVLRNQVPSVVAARGLLASIHFSWFDHAEDRLQEALSMFRAVHDLEGVAETLCGLSAQAAYVDRHDVARALAEEAHQSFRKVDRARADERMAATLANLARWRGDLDSAQQMFERELQRAVAAGDWGHRLKLLHQLAEIAALRWDGEGAIRWGREALAAGETLQRPGAVRGAHLVISYGLFIQDHCVEALEHARASLRLDWEMGVANPLTLEQLALCAGGVDQLEPAACLWGIVDGLRESIGVQAPAIARSIYEKYRSGVRDDLGETAWVSAHRKGRSFTTSEAVGYAIEVSAP